VEGESPFLKARLDTTITGDLKNTDERRIRFKKVAKKNVTQLLLVVVIVTRFRVNGTNDKSGASRFLVMDPSPCDSRPFPNELLNLPGHTPLLELGHMIIWTQLNKITIGSLIISK
jgi:hypothetical protein